MSKRIKIAVAVTITSAFLTILTQSAFGCFAVVVGKNASTDGSVLLGHNEQNSGQRFLNFRKISKLKYKDGTEIVTKDGQSIPQTKETYAYLWSENPGCTSSDAYINEYGVAIVSDFCPDRGENLEQLKKEGQIQGADLGYLLRRIVIQRAKTAKEGVKVAGDLIDKYGYTSSRSFVIADPNEAWIMAVTQGKQWVAERVKDDQVALLPNVYTIGDIDFKDSKNFIFSKNLVSYAEKKGWYKPEKDKQFNFANTYSEPRKQLVDPRHWVSEQLVTQKKVDRLNNKRLPFSVKPAYKVNVKDVIEILRYTKEDNYIPEMYKIMTKDGKKFNPPEGWVYRDICIPRTQEGAVFQLNSKYPPAIGCIYWRTSAEPKTSVLLPWYLGITRTPVSYYNKGKNNNILSEKNHYSPDFYNYEENLKKSWWVFKKLQDEVNKDTAVRTVYIRNIWNKFENRLFNKQPKIQAKAIKIYKKNKDKAYKYLTKYCAKTSKRAEKEAVKLIDYFENQDKNLKPSDNKKQDDAIHDGDACLISTSDK